ncbi:hypothetical protein [Streptomyces sp. NRRL F-5126]|uniref:hypothetical protein n=1 Tax=Streptomyces sp. NRRL F-5126 TaxID=1463857 RepID=UPI0004CB5661|nr:hypothetical protein [Streptomyces sp. NRRL F-5126]
MKNETTVPPSEPARPLAPVSGCDVCAACFSQWQEASTEGHPAFDPSHAADLAAEIGRHPHPRLGGAS